MLRIFAITILVFTAMPVFAQHERYELGRRLKRFEQAWEKQTEPAARKRAAAILPDITGMFFSLRFGDAGKTLDRARHLLSGSEEPSPTTQWLESLTAVPEKTLYSDEKEVVVTVKPFYSVKVDPPAGATATLRWKSEMPISVSLTKFPVKIAFPHDPTSKSGVARIQFTVLMNGKPVSETVQRVTFVSNLPKRLESYRAFAKRTPATIESATIKNHSELLEELADGTIPENDLSAAALIAQADSILESPTYFVHDQSGQFLLSVPLDKKKTQPLRLLVPKGLDAKKPLPVVVALHGAGGSENLFFEGYGAGHIVKECEKRGWLLVSPRSGINFGSGPPVKAILDRLGERYPIDRTKVFVVGHSMGAAQTVALCQEQPGLFTAAAALGGGGRVQPGKFPKLPFFIGVGDKDFALQGARALSKALPDAKFKEYPGLEHMLIVREALPDLFAIWDSIGAR